MNFRSRSIAADDITPAPWRQIILAIFALIILLVVLQRFLGFAI